jgi:hypothetical protein
VNSRNNRAERTSERGSAERRGSESTAFASPTRERADDAAEELGVEMNDVMGRLWGQQMEVLSSQVGPVG